MHMSDKKTVLPKLRFKEFDSFPKWEITTLGKISAPVEEKLGNRDCLLMSVTAGKGLVPQKEKFGREIAGASYKNYLVIKKNDFAYNKSSTKQFPEGYISMLKDYEEAAIPNSIFTCFRIVDEHCCPDFFNQLFQSNYHGAWLKKYIEIGARAHGSLSIDNRYLREMPIAIPQMEEQVKIARCLSFWDKQIEAENDKLEALKMHKKGLMQKLFPDKGTSTPRWRFPEFRNSSNWISDTIGKRCTSYSGGTPDTSKKEFYKGDIPFIRSGEIDAEKTELLISEEGLRSSSAKMVSVGDVLVALYGANSGEVALSKINGAINQAVLCLNCGECNPFIYQYLLYKKNWITTTYLQGGQGNLSGEIIRSIELFFPSPEEQKRIADFLCAVDKTIKKQKEKVDCLKRQKKGLLQGLFPSIEEVLK